MPSTSLLPYEEVNTGQKPQTCVIWLHGLGADGHDFVPIAHELQLKRAIRFIFPHAPARPITINGGMTMPSWYDILSMNIEREIDIPQILESSNAIHQLIQAQLDTGIQSGNIIIAGFSQGGAVAYHAALTFPQKLGGLIALSTYFATEASIHFERCNRQIPILIQHGTMDPIVPEILGQKADQSLKNNGFFPKYLTYPMEHTLCPNQIFDMNEWLNDKIAAS